MGLGDWFPFFGGRRAKVDLWRRYEQLHESSSGTMSKFYKARDRQSGEIVGVKLVDMSKMEPIERRYRRLGKPNEGEIGAAIKGSNIVTTLDWGTTLEGGLFIVEEFVEGRLLHVLISSRKPIEPARRIRFIRQAATAVGSVHAAGFVHRDICARNFLVTPDDRLMLFDFGLSVPDKPAFLQPGNRVGTPNYMSPEVVRRRPLDKRLDLFSLGVTAFEIGTLDLPWPRGSTGRAALSHDSPPTDIRAAWPDIPDQLAAAIHACIEADPAKRPASAEAFLRMFAAVEA
ncbi:MAG: serine/threonine-protein kinase [Planctomycetia bacterium]